MPPGDGHHLRLPAVLEKRFHRFADDDLGDRVPKAERLGRAGPVEQRVEDAPGADGGVVDARRHSGPDHDQRHAHRGLIEQIAVERLAVVAETLAVIADDDDAGRAGDALLERGHEPAELRVHRGHFAQVRLAREPAAVGLRRRVGIVRVEVVDPEEERLGGLLCQVRDGGVGRFASTTRSTDPRGSASS